MMLIYYTWDFHFKFLYYKKTYVGPVSPVRTEPGGQTGLVGIVVYDTIAIERWLTKQAFLIQIIGEFQWK